MADARVRDWWSISLTPRKVDWFALFKKVALEGDEWTVVDLKDFFFHSEQRKLRKA